MSSCLYCKNKKSNHFICGLCNSGMCDDCFDTGMEHSAHFHRLIEDEILGDKVEAKEKELDTNLDYLCGACVDKL